ncbi:hypothetical protein [Paracoccus spongiarum]|uniref:Uncharacterized protein n=1 Tax=Paracoccus spongiarum TaxID=3064387 RepID=A0ABT9JI53_9RHOB|nr:hypothetical protein [Paracoccus sp. 2205BS29-5]MDP5308716.1 hypothetical protein [Paracoccus sp. 2205BS29-5]
MFSTIRVPARLIPDLPWLALTAGCAVPVSSNIVAVVGVLRLPSAIRGRA